MSIRGQLLGGFLFASFIVSLETRAANSDWRVRDMTKSESPVSEEKSIERRRVVIRQRTVSKAAPSIYLDRIEMETARKIRLEEKTAELIKQLEDLIRRPGQQARVGELKMRLAELYFERSQAVAAKESERWADDVKRWETSKKGARPELKTPKADAYRQQALTLYLDLERMSRGSDMGKSLMIRRDDVLFFLGSTLSDLGRRAEAQRHYEELVAKFSKSPRLFAARLALADMYFEAGQFDKAVSHYLRIAAGDGAPAGAEAEVANLKPYAFYKLSWCYQNQNQPAKAVLALQRTLEVSKGSSSDQRLAFEREALNDLARAFALAGQYKEGEDWFDSSGYGSDELVKEFRRNVVDVARDRGQWSVAVENIDKLLKADPEAPGARDLALDRVKIVGKQGNLEVYAKALAEFTKTYGDGSDWLAEQKLTGEEKKLLVEDAVGELRREAKSYHRTAQARDRKEFYRQALPFYAAYFSVVPEPNKDSPENMHEMRFFYAELLYKLDDSAKAAEQYALVGEGKFGAAADYSRIVALKDAAKKDSGMSKDLAEATKAFIEKNPKDERAGDLLYSAAYGSFQSKNYDDALLTLRDIVARFPNKSMGVESAERILFIHEEQKNFDAGMADVDAFLANKTLVATGGADFAKRLSEYKSRGQFKRLDDSGEGSDKELAAKAKGYLDLSRTLTGDLKEKALNNALVFARKANDAALVQQSSDALMAQFPGSKYASGLYFERAETFLKQARWSDALGTYDTYLKVKPAAAAKGAKTADKEAAEQTEAILANKYYVQARIEGYGEPELAPARDLSPALVSGMKEFLATYPKNKNRSDFVTILAFRKGATAEDIAALRKLPGLDGKDKSTLDEATIVASVRKAAGNAKELERIAKANPPAKATTPLLREALGDAKFRGIEPAFDAYQKRKIDPKPSRFAGSLREKVNQIERLDKDYMGVVAYGSAEAALKSLERLSKLYGALAADIERVPGTPEEKQALEGFAKPLRDKGLGFLRSCLDKATEYKVAGEGVQVCLSAAISAGVEKTLLTHERAPAPQWIPAGSSSRPLLKSLSSALAGNRFGEFRLALSFVEKAEPPFTEPERAELENLTGLAEWKLGNTQDAVKAFREASDTTGGESANLRQAALKNLAALDLQVRDYRAALDVLASMPEGEPDVAFMRGLGLMGTGQPKEAVSAYAAGLVTAPANTKLMFHLALAQAAMGDAAGAVKSMTGYVERETPPGSDVSRTLLRQWKGVLQ